MKWINKLEENSCFTNIIVLNIVVFILVSICNVYFFLSQNNTDILLYLGVSSNTDILFKRPWTIITYMFVHIDILHIILNLMVFYFCGKILTNYLSQKQLLAIYLTGGIIGATTYIIAFNIFPVFLDLKLNSIAIGASASVLSILFASATIAPNTHVYHSSIKLKYVAILYMIIDIMSIPEQNAGGHIAHLGGALYGYIYIYMLNFNINLGYITEQFISIFSNQNTSYQKRYESDYEYNARKKKEEKKINLILEKITKSGYDSLSEDEKEILFKQN